MTHYDPQFVTCIDTFLSDWGPADGRDNLLIFECNNRREADIVAGNALRRTDQTDVETHDSDPGHYLPNRETDEHGGYISGKYYVQIKTRADMPTWYTEGAF